MMYAGRRLENFFPGGGGRKSARSSRPRLPHYRLSSLSLSPSLSLSLSLSLPLPHSLSLSLSLLSLSLRVALLVEVQKMFLLARRRTLRHVGRVGLH